MVASTIVRTHHRRAAVLAISVVLLPSSSVAQVNVERLRGDLKDRPALGTVDGAFTGRTGNVESIVLGASALGAARWRRHRFFGSTQADYARFDRETRVSKSFIHLRYGFEVNAMLQGEAFVQQQQDKFQRLLIRELVGAGPRVILRDAKDLRVAIGTALMFEYERIRVAAGADDAPLSHVFRVSSYASATWQLDNRMRALGTVYVQPRVDELADVRVLFEAAVTTDITGSLGLKVLATVRHDSLPPTLVKQTDVEVRNAITLTF